MLSAEELSSLDTNSLLLKLSLMPLAGDLEDEDLEVAPFLSPFPLTCFSCFFFFFFDLSLRGVGWAEGRGAALPGWPWEQPDFGGPSPARPWAARSPPVAVSLAAHAVFLHGLLVIPPGIFCLPIPLLWPEHGVSEVPPSSSSSSSTTPPCSHL